MDRITYSLFDLEPGVPTDAYELETAVAVGSACLFPPHSSGGASIAEP